MAARPSKTSGSTRLQTLVILWILDHFQEGSLKKIDVPLPVVYQGCLSDVMWLAALKRQFPTHV